MKCAATPGRPDFRALSAEFRELSASGSPLLDTLHSFGRAHTASAKVMRPKRLRGFTSKLVTSTGTLRQQQQSKKTFCEQGVAILRQTMGSARAIDRAVVWAKQFEKHQREAATKAANSDAEALVTFAGSLGKQQIEDMAKQYSFVCMEHFKPLPFGDTVLLEHHPPLANTAIAAAHVALADYQRSNLGTKLSQFWESWHQTVPNVASKEKTSQEPLCFREGVCFCTGRGTMLKRMRSSFNAFLSRIARHKLHWKGLLRDGSLVVELCLTTGTESTCGLARAEPMQGASYSSVVASSSSSSRGPQAEPWLFHISMMYLSPIRATLQLLRKVPNPSSSAESLAMPRLCAHNKATAMFYTDLEAMQLLSLEASWTAKLYRLDESAMPTGSIQPQTILLVALEGSEPSQIWPPPKKVGSSAKRPIAHPGWELALEIAQLGNEANDDDNDDKLAFLDEEGLEEEADLGGLEGNDIENLILIAEAQELLEERRAARKQRKVLEREE
eukprot:3657439-Amphidinium_carterae.1